MDRHISLDEAIKSLIGLYYSTKAKRKWIAQKMVGVISRNNNHRKLLVCIYTNKDKNEFAIGLEEDENFRAITKPGESYTRFVDAFDETKVVVDEKEIDWKQRLKKWIAFAKEDETIFTEIDLSGWNKVGERKKEN